MILTTTKTFLLKKWVSLTNQLMDFEETKLIQHQELLQIDNHFQRGELFLAIIEIEMKTFKKLKETFKSLRLIDKEILTILEVNQ